jgi:hypothetical protein
VLRGYGDLAAVPDLSADAIQFLKAATTSMLSNRNCFKLLVKMITASPIARCPSFKFLTMQMQPPASWARNCGPFYP